MKNTLFGTDGIRATVGASPLTSTELRKLGNAIGTWITSKYGNNQSILIGYDTRRSCPLINATLQSSLLLHPITIIDAGIITTPALAKILMHDTTFACGIMISASHNQYHDNGIKIIDRLGKKLDNADELSITNLFVQQQKDQSSVDTIGYAYHSAFYKNYEQLIIKQFYIPEAHRKTIVLDCAHGAAYKIAPSIFKTLGFNVIALATTPTGFNINNQCGSTYPHSLQQAVVALKADCGFAFDGDADRVIAVNKQGLIKDGDDLLALLTKHPRYCDQKIIVGTSMTNQGLQIYLEAHNKKLIRAQVGDKYVAQELYNNNVLLGGESSGHIIMNDYLPIGDGIACALAVLESMHNNNNWLMETFQKFPQITGQIHVKERKDLSQKPFCAILAESRQELVDGRLIVRYSGTEPVLRIMVEHRIHEQALSIHKKLTQQLQEKLS